MKSKFYILALMISMIGVSTYSSNSMASESGLKDEARCRIRTSDGDSERINNDMLEEVSEGKFVAKFKQYKLMIIYLNDHPHRLFIENTRTKLSAFTNLRADGRNTVVQVFLADDSTMQAVCTITPTEK